MATINHDPSPEKRGSMTFKLIHIGKDVWIGANVTITPGVTIGGGANVAAGAVGTKSLLPTFEMREELAHLLLHLLNCQILTGILVYHIGELCAVVNHLLHSHILRKPAILVAVNTVILIGCTVGIRAKDFVC